MTEAARDARPPERPQSPVTNVVPREARLLLVDDDPLLLRALAEVVRLRLDGVVCETCRSPVDALRAVEEREYDVVVSDLLMGGIHGLDLLVRVRTLRPSTLVVLITGVSDRDVSVRALRGGAYDFIQKPVDPDYLVACLRRAIETRRLRLEVERQQAALRAHAEELEATVAERTDELRRANRSKDEFLATVSHELRTPLTSVLGWARLLSGGRLDAAESAQAIESIARNARSQAQLIDELLDVSRIITGKLRLEIRQIDPFRVLQAALSVVLPAAQAKNIQVERRFDESVGLIQGDPHRLQQVLWNLLSNAVKFTPSGGHVSVRLTRLDAGIEIAVHDDGAGIEAAFLPFVFERFRQSETLAASRRGLGLGLAIARHLVELHGGTITAESPGPGEGATFTVTLPAPAREPDEARAPRRELVSQGAIDTPRVDCLRGIRVLVIEDEPDTRDVLRVTLTQAGAAVELASSVAEAQEVFRRTRPDAVLCDIGLGSEDGYALLRALRALPAELGGGVPAIALTGFARPEDRMRALVAGFDLHVAKPGPADLPEIIARLLGRGEFA